MTVTNLSYILYPMHTVYISKNNTNFQQCYQKTLQCTFLLLSPFAQLYTIKME